jgi:hypothetical protein
MHRATVTLTGEKVGVRAEKNRPFSGRSVLSVQFLATGAILKELKIHRCNVS